MSRHHVKNEPIKDHSHCAGPDGRVDETASKRGVTVLLPETQLPSGKTSDSIVQQHRRQRASEQRDGQARC
jgi:hypothetical protein